MEENAAYFEQFLQQCKVLTENDYEVLQILRKRFARAADSYIATDDFRQLLRRTLSQMKEDSRNKYVHLKEFASELKAYAVKKGKKDAPARVEKGVKESDAVSHEKGHKANKRSVTPECAAAAPPAKKARVATSVVQHERKHDSDDEERRTGKDDSSGPKTPPKVQNHSKKKSESDSKSSKTINGFSRELCDTSDSDHTSRKEHPKVSTPGRSSQSDESIIDSAKKSKTSVVIEKIPASVIRKIVPEAVTEADDTSQNEAFKDFEKHKEDEDGTGGDDEQDEPDDEPREEEVRKDGEEVKQKDKDEEGEQEGDASAAKQKKKEKKRKATAEQIRRLEALLGEIDGEIKKIQSRELSLDDLEQADSDYLLEDRYKKKFVKVWDKLCELKDRATSTGRITERKFRFEGTRFQEINTKIERFINKRREFPDFRDVLDIVRHCSIKHNLHLNRKRSESIARDAFTCIGNSLQKRRMEDFSDNFGSSLTDAYRVYDDPALYDKELKRKLDRNKEDGKSRIDAVISKFVRKQEAEGDETDEEDDEEDMEEENAEKENEKNVDEEVEKEILDKTIGAGKLKDIENVVNNQEAVAGSSSDNDPTYEVLEIESSEDEEEAEADSGGEDSDLIIEDDDPDEKEARKPSTFPLHNSSDSLSHEERLSSTLSSDQLSSTIRVDIKSEIKEEVETDDPPFMQALGLTSQKADASVDAKSNPENSTDAAPLPTTSQPKNGAGDVPVETRPSKGPSILSALALTKESKDKSPPAFEKKTAPAPTGLPIQSGSAMLNEFALRAKDTPNSSPTMVEKSKHGVCVLPDILLGNEAVSVEEDLPNVKPPRKRKHALPNHAPRIPAGCIVVDLDDGEQEDPSSHSGKLDGSKDKEKSKESLKGAGAQPAQRSVQKNRSESIEDCKIIAEVTSSSPGALTGKRDVVKIGSSDTAGEDDDAVIVDDSSLSCASPVKLSDALIASLKKGSASSHTSPKEETVPEVSLSEGLLASLSKNKVTTSDVNLSNELLASLARSDQSAVTETPDVVSLDSTDPIEAGTSNETAPRSASVEKTTKQLCTNLAPTSSSSNRDASVMKDSIIQDDVSNKTSSSGIEAVEIADSPAPSVFVDSPSVIVDSPSVIIDSESKGDDETIVAMDEDSPDIFGDVPLIIGGNHPLVAGATLLSVEMISPTSRVLPTDSEPSVVSEELSEPQSQTTAIETSVDIAIEQASSQENKFVPTSNMSASDQVLNEDSPDIFIEDSVDSAGEVADLPEQAPDCGTEDTPYQFTITNVTSVQDMSQKDGSHGNENVKKSNMSSSDQVPIEDSPDIFIEDSVDSATEVAELPENASSLDDEEPLMSSPPGLVISDTGQLLNSEVMGGGVRLVSVQPVIQSNSTSKSSRPALNTSETINQGASTVTPNVEQTYNDSASNVISKTSNSGKPVSPSCGISPPANNSCDVEEESVSTAKSDDKPESAQDQGKSETTEVLSDDDDDDDDDDSDSCQISPRLRRKHGGLQPTGDILKRLKERQKQFTKALDGDSVASGNGPSVVIEVDRSDDEDGGIMGGKRTDTADVHSSVDKINPSSAANLKLATPVKEVAKRLLKSSVPQYALKSSQSSSSSVSASRTSVAVTNASSSHSSSKHSVNRLSRNSSRNRSTKPVVQQSPTQTVPAQRLSQPARTNYSRSPAPQLFQGASPRVPLMGLHPLPRPARLQGMPPNTNMFPRFPQNGPIRNQTPTIPPQIGRVNRNLSHSDVVRMANLLRLASPRMPGGLNRPPMVAQNRSKPGGSPSRSRRQSLSKKPSTSRTTNSALPVASKSRTGDLKIASYQSLSTGLHVSKPQTSHRVRHSSSNAHQKPDKRTEKPALIVLSDSE